MGCQTHSDCESGVCDVDACVSYHAWSKAFASVAPAGISVDNLGNLVWAGSLSGTTNLGAGPIKATGASADVLIAGFDASGGSLWSQQLTGDSARTVTGVAASNAGDVVVAGHFYGKLAVTGILPMYSAGASDVFVAALAKSGTPKWAKSFGAADYQNATDVAVDAGGNIIVLGDLYGSIDFGLGPLVSAGNSDIFVAKLGPSGDPIWSKRFGSANAQEARSVAVDDDGNVVVLGWLFGAGSIDFGGGVLTSAGGDDLVLAKFDPDGKHLWSKRFGDSMSQEGTSVAVDGMGNVIVVGHFWGSIDFGGGALVSTGGRSDFIVKLSASGDHLWSKAFPGGSLNEWPSVTADAAGNVAATGSLRNAINFGGGELTPVGSAADVFVVEFDASGNHLWSKRFGDLGIQDGSAVALLDPGHVVVTGKFTGTVDFGGDPLTSAGSVETFLTRLRLPKGP